ncbi:FtsX-like permease family protein [Roseivirga spongicola]|uniref:ABC3 transporter permease C-terminal domain-containing protein n=1 Tax=Roseivirga spongicola TaxID=333140 RepID=A0A150X985_9BACT|nr:FtsX-like permease family protein [Roseivirga spongicola]KYG75244.1 hypothetical protein AWW68_10580 [Roseivirga spongicola]WPZ08601.1 FtsX-like permease family protein [Roseivirga spongicola]
MENNKTPRFWTKIFKWLCHDSLFEELQGDLEESYINNTNTRGERKAKAIYRKEVLKMVRGSVIQAKLPIPKKLKLSLFRMHFILSLRSIKRNTSFTILNVVGFAAAISVCLFIANTILTAYQLDKSFTNKENIYRISTHIHDRDGSQFTSYSPVYLYGYLNTILPEAKRTTGFKELNRRMSFRGRDIDISSIEASPNFLELLDYKVLEGAIETVIENPSHIALTKDFVDKYSLGPDLIGKDFGGHIISAVLESPKLTSHLGFEWLNYNDQLDYVPPVELKYEYYVDRSRVNYIEIHDNAEIEIIEEKLNRFASNINDTLDTKSYKFQLENLATLGLSKASLYQSDLLTSEGIEVMLIFILIMTVIASINYTNLASAKAMHRLKEIGVRKVIGSKKSHILSQFLIETGLLGLLGLGLGFLIYFWFSKDVGDLIPFGFNPQISAPTILVFIITALLVSLIAGIVPGIFLSKISPLNLFRPKISKKSFSLHTLRKVLLVIQLTVSAFVFVFGSLFWKQYDTYQSEELSMDIRDTYMLDFDWPDSTKHLRALKNEIDKIPEVEASSFMSKLIPIDDVNGLMMIKTESESDSILTSISWADTSFLHTHQPEMKLLNASIIKNNSSSMLVNQSLLDQLNIPLESALGTIIKSGENLHPIAGVFEKSISTNYSPIVSVGKENGDNFSETVILKPNSINNLLIVKVNNQEKSFDKIESEFLNLFPEKQLTFRSIESLARNRYSELRNVLKIFTYVFLCIILITLMGQMGMAIFNANIKAKEIGIRKVLGASVPHLSFNLVKGTLTQVIIALLIAIPIATLLFKNAMGDYRNPIPLTPQLYSSIILIFVLIIVITVVTLIVPRAKANPTESLRNE